MRIPPEKILTSLNNDGLQPLYVIAGDEPLIVQETCDAVRRHCRENGFEERVVFDIDGKFSWGAFIEETNSLSLFSQRKIIEARFKTGKLSKDAAEALTSYLASTSPDTTVILQMPKMEKAETNKKWFKEADRQGCIITIWPIERNKLPQWILRRAQAGNLKIDPEALDLLVERTEGNLLAASQELQKLSFLTLDRTISSELVLASVSECSRYSVFDLVNMILLRNTAKALHILHNLLAEGVQPTIILWALSRQIRQLYDVIGSQEKTSRLRLPQKTMEALNHFLSGLKKSDLDTLLSLSHFVDKSVKGAEKTSPTEALSKLVTTFCNPKLAV